MTNIAIENGHLVDLAIEHGDFPEFFVKNNQRAPLKVSAEP